MDRHYIGVFPFDEPNHEGNASELQIPTDQHNPETAPAPLDQPEPDFVLRRQGLKLLQHLLGGKVLLAQSLGVADDRGVAHVILASITKYAGPSRRFGRSARKYSSPKRAAGSAYVGESATMRWPDFTIYQKATHKQ